MDILSNLYSNNVVVNVVFGIKDIKRVESSEFLSNGVSTYKTALLWQVSCLDDYMPAHSRMHVMHVY